MLVDPAVNLVFQQMSTGLKESRDKLEQAQNDLSAWKFTPDRLARRIVLIVESSLFTVCLHEFISTL